MKAFEWEEHHFPIGVPCKPKDICKKLPMKKQVVTEANELWEYYFNKDGRIRWVYLGSVTSIGTLVLL